MKRSAIRKAPPSEYMAASALDPTDQKLLDKARLYKQLEDLANSSGKALDDIKAGKVEQGVGTLKDIMVTTARFRRPVKKR